jgi:signal transduction histidine kinase
VDLRAVVDSTLGLIGPLLAERRVRVERNYAPEVPAVTADPSAMKQLVLNLLKNGADALEKSGGTLRISALPACDGHEAVLRVEDDGPGIPADVRSRIFDPFVTTKSAGRGTGLGLSICRRIAEAHRGSLEAGDAAGGGAAFTLRLPAETSDGAKDRA